MLLIDRKMPKSCIDCVCNNDNYWCNMTGDELDCDIAWTGRMPNCPLKEEERKKGKWIYKSSLGWGESWVCSECGERTVSSIMGEPRFNYCPMCGLKMSKGEEDETDRR